MRQHQKRHEIPVDSLTAEIEKARRVGRATESPSAMASASLGKPKLHGLIVDRSRIADDPDEPLKVHVTDRERAKALAVLFKK